MDENRYCVACGVLLTATKKEPTSAYGLLCLACHEHLYPPGKRNSMMVPVKHCRKCGVMFVAPCDGVFTHTRCPA